MKKLNFFLVDLMLLSLASLSFVACSDNDNNDQPVSNTWTLDESNSNMPTDGTIVAQYSDAPVGHGIGNLVDGDDNTVYTTFHSKFYITWKGSKSEIVRT